MNDTILRYKKNLNKKKKVHRYFTRTKKEVTFTTTNSARIA